MPERVTIPNPNGKGYRMTCPVNTEDVSVDYSMKYPTIRGNKINILGQIEDIMPLEQALEVLRKLQKQSP